MARLTAWVAALALLVCASIKATSAATYGNYPPYDETVIVNRGVSMRPAYMRPGRKFRLIGRVTITNFGNADRVYCAFKNLNHSVPTLRTAWGTPEAKSQPKLKAPGYVKSTYLGPKLGTDKAYVEFYQAGAKAIENKRWSIIVRGIRLTPEAEQETQIWWRWYCEAYWDNPNAFKKEYPIGMNDFAVPIRN